MTNVAACTVVAVVVAAAALKRTIPVLFWMVWGSGEKCSVLREFSVGAGDESVDNGEHHTQNRPPGGAV